MIPPWPSPYGGPSDELPYHLRPTDLLRADEPWIAALYVDGPDPVVVPAPAVAGRPSARGNPADGAAAGATQDRPPGPTATTATGRPGGHHGDRDEGGLPADRTVRPAPAVLSAPAPADPGYGRTEAAPSRPGHGAADGRACQWPGSAGKAAGAPGRHRAERPGTAPAAAVPGRAVLRWLEVWVPRLFGLALVFVGSAGVGALAAVLVTAYGRR